MMKVNKLALAITALLVSGGALAHGFISNPPSRDTMCQLGLNDGDKCTGAQYEPQSVGESAKGFPAAGTPPDGKLVSSGKSLGGGLDEQTAGSWKKNKMSPGENDFTWHFTAKHKTQDWKYFITKPDWNPNQPLTRDSFDLVPFCTVEGNQQLPESSDATHKCMVPERTGYQVIFASWEVSDTANSFYKVIDVDFEGTVPSEWPNSVGKINPYKDLKAGDSVLVRLFTPEEAPDRSITLNINSNAEGKAAVWGKALATKINEEYQDLRAGAKNAEGSVDPVAGLNTIYTKKDSNIKTVEIDVVSNSIEQPKLEIEGVEKEYLLTDGAVKINVAGTATAKSVVTAALYTKSQKQIDSQKMTIGENGKIALSLEGAKLKAGDYTLVVIASAGKGAVKQQTISVQLKENAGGGNANAEFTYPDNMSSYVGGTKVLQSKNGKVYQCKDGAVGGWCKIYAKSANHYEPGVGSNWQDAWTEVGAAKKAR